MLIEEEHLFHKQEQERGGFGKQEKGGQQSQDDKTNDEDGAGQHTCAGKCPDQ